MADQQLSRNETPSLDDLSKAASPGPWTHYCKATPDADEARAELASMVGATEQAHGGVHSYDLHGVGYEIEKFTLYTALTGCAPASAANAAFICELVNAYRAGDLVMRSEIGKIQPQERAAGSAARPQSDGNAHRAQVPSSSDKVEHEYENCPCGGRRIKGQALQSAGGSLPAMGSTAALPENDDDAKRFLDGLLCKPVDGVTYAEVHRLLWLALAQQERIRSHVEAIPQDVRELLIEARAWLDVAADSGISALDDMNLSTPNAERCHALSTRIYNALMGIDRPGESTVTPDSRVKP